MNARIYKVVKNENGKFYSVFADGLARTEYVPDRWVFPPEPFDSYGYGIYGFLYLSSATLFHENLQQPAVIWVADAINVRSINLPRFYYPLADIKTIKDIRNRIKEPICGYKTYDDEVFCDSIKLIRPVNPFESLYVPLVILENFVTRQDLTWADFAKIIQSEQRPGWIKEIYRMSLNYGIPIPMTIFKYLASLFCPMCKEICICNHWKPEEKEDES